MAIVHVPAYTAKSSKSERREAQGTKCSGIVRQPLTSREETSWRIARSVRAGCGSHFLCSVMPALYVIQVTALKIRGALSALNESAAT